VVTTPYWGARIELMEVIDMAKDDAIDIGESAWRTDIPECRKPESYRHY
jgi:hypothetical protein